MAGAVGLREVRYGYEGANHLDPAKDESQPLFHLRSVEVHRLLALRARLRGGAGHLRADHRRPRLRLRVSRRAGRRLPRLRMRLLRRLRAGLPDRDAEREDRSSRSAQPEHSRRHHLRLLRRRLLLQGRDAAASEVVRMVPYKDGKANHGHSCVKGRFAWGYATHKDRITQADDPREDHRSLARGVAGTRRSPTPPREFKRIQAKYGRGSIGGITSSRCTNEETFLVQKLIRAALRQQQRRHLRPRLPLADRLRPEDHLRHLGRHAGFRLASSTADVILVIGANPTDGHPVFASRMKRRLREGAKLIVIDPRRIDLVRTPHVEADYHLPLQPGTNVAVLNAMAHVDRHRGPGRRGLRRASAATRTSSQDWARVRRRAAQHARKRSKPITGVPAGRSARRGAALRHRRQRRDLLRPRRHRAQPGLDHGHGASPTSPWRPATSAATASA